ncbi:DUF4921 family protein [Candidatus Uhrbacteria bacterium]|nr:DUF4921 family protein [Candidatus Uhrbacteria bacterium]
MATDGSHLLQDEITGDWVIVAPVRRNRPDGRAKRQGDVFAPSRIPADRLIASYGRGENRMSVIQNIFPVFHQHVGIRGRQEIIIEGSRVMPFCDSSPARIAALLDAFTERFTILRKDRTVQYLQAFKNEGAAAGASQPHPHSQIFAVSFVPDRLRDEAARRKRALKRLGMTSHEHALCLASEERLIYSDRHVFAFANPAARFAYEVRILPKRRVDNITKTTPAERRSLARAIHALLPLMKRRKYSYNFFFHDVLDERDEPFEIRFVPRANIWGGFELDAGISVNPVPAEIAAREYRMA